MKFSPDTSYFAQAMRRLCTRTKPLRRVLAAGALLTVAWSPSLSWAGDVLKLKDDRPNEYVVVKGDTLWDISAMFLDTPWRWPELWGFNSQIHNPHLIYPGDVIYLVWVDGKPQLKVKRAMRKLGPSLKAEPLARAIPMIRLKDILAFLEDNRVMSEQSYLEAPYILASKDRRIIAGAGDRVYARGELLDQELKQQVFRATGDYRDPTTNELLGYELTKIADVTLVAKESDILSLNVNRSYQELRTQDRVLPLESQDIRSVFYPKAVAEDTQGVVLSVLGGVRDGGQYNVIAVNLGANQDIQEGDVFAIHRKGEAVVDPITEEVVTLPAERSGIAMVFKTFEKVSYALILSSTNVVSSGDQVKAP